MAKKETPAIAADILANYEKLVANNADAERKGATMPYTSCNGHMFSFLAADGTLALRLPAEEREAFIKKYKTSLMEAHGVVMKEYVKVPASLLGKTKELQPYFDSSYTYVKSLKPKPAKKK